MENTQELTKDQASLLLNNWRDKPQTYIDQILGVQKIWKLQDQLLNTLNRAMDEHKPIYIGSGHALGKDYICAAISPWFLHCFSPSIVIQTAPTDRQVKKIMWAETLGHWNNRKIDLGGTAYANPYLEIRKEDWYLIGFTTKETGASRDSGGGKFQGFHSPNICVIVSEAQAVEDNIYDQIDAITTSERVLVIFIGNPTRATGRFAKGLRDKKNNIVFNFSCLENPNYIHKKTMIPGLASYEWVEDKRRKWGEEDPRWVSRVLGQIPDTALNNTFPQSLILNMHAKDGLLARHASNIGVSVDPAGEGMDDNVFMSGNGGDILNLYKKANMTPTEIAIKAVQMCHQVNGFFIIVDCDGLGIGAYQELCNMPESYTQGIRIVKFHGSGKSSEVDLMDDGTERPLYQNMRSEASFVTQKRGRDGLATIKPQAKQMIEDLMEEEFFTNQRGVLQIEPKEDIKERLGRSPGEGDCYKMLQWAFQQDYKDDRFSIYGREDRQPAYGITEDNLLATRDLRRLPRHAIMG